MNNQTEEIEAKIVAESVSSLLPILTKYKITDPVIITALGESFSKGIQIGLRLAYDAFEKINKEAQ